MHDLPAVDTVDHVSACVAVIAGDVARHARAGHEGGDADLADVCRELANLWLSAPRWVRELGGDWEAAKAAAVASQKSYASRHTTPEGGDDRERSRCGTCGGRVVDGVCERRCIQ